MMRRGLVPLDVAGGCLEDFAGSVAHARSNGNGYSRCFGFSRDFGNTFRGQSICGQD